MRLKTGCLKSEKFLIPILLLTLLITSIVQSHGQNTSFSADSQISNMLGLIKHTWLDRSIIPPAAFNRPPERPSMPIGPITGMPLITYSYSVYATDYDGDQLSYFVDWGDGTASRPDAVEPGVASILNHSWAKAGTFKIRSKAADSHGSSSQWSDPLIVVINMPPNAPTMPEGTTLGNPEYCYSYSTSASDPDGDPLEYTIDWGDNSFSTTACTDSGMMENLSHAWAKAGVYRVRANATDCREASSEWSDPLIVIINTPPNSPSVPIGPDMGYANASYSFLTSANDPDQDPLIYTFDWGDGTENTSGMVESGIDINLTHTWRTPGVYCVSASAKDRMGNLANWSEKECITIVPNDRPEVPRDLYGLRNGFTGIAYTCFTMADDPDGDDVKYVFDWGDGNTSATDYVKSGSLENASHIWSRAGEYSVKADAIDLRGAPSGWSGPIIIKIAANDPPDTPAIPSGPTNGQRQWTYEYKTSARDPDGDVVKYVFDWGDGTTSWTGFDFANSGEVRKSYHKWLNPGIFQIKAAALDDKGAISGWSKTLAIKIA